MGPRQQDVSYERGPEELTLLLQRESKVSLWNPRLFCICCQTAMHVDSHTAIFIFFRTIRLTSVDVDSIQENTLCTELCKNDMRCDAASNSQSGCSLGAFPQIAELRKIHGGSSRRDVSSLDGLHQRLARVRSSSLAAAYCPAPFKWPPSYV